MIPRHQLSPETDGRGPIHSDEALAACETIRRLGAEAQPDLTQIARIVGEVPALRESVLRKVNGIRHALPHPIVSAEHAVVFLGVAGVCQLAESELQRRLPLQTTRRVDEKTDAAVHSAPHTRPGTEDQTGAPRNRGTRSA